MAAAESFGQQALSQLDSQIAEVEDMLSYCNDVLNTGVCAHPGGNKGLDYRLCVCAFSQYVAMPVGLAWASLYFPSSLPKAFALVLE
jgi:hypothetical protein